MRKLHIRWAGGEVCSLQFRDLPAAVKSSRSDSTRGRADQGAELAGPGEALLVP